MKSDNRQEHVYYATHPTATKELLKIPELILNTRIWECCAGGGRTYVKYFRTKWIYCV